MTNPIYADIAEDLPPGAEAGIELAVEETPSALRYESVAGWTHWALTSDEGLILAAAIDDYLMNAAFVRGPAHRPQVPPIRAAEARAVFGQANVARGWLRFFARMVTAERVLPRHYGTWWLVHYSSPPVRVLGYSGQPYGPDLPWPPAPPHRFEAALDYQPYWEEEWSAAGIEGVAPGTPLALRPPSAEDDGRVKAWRRAARERTLPPVLLLYQPLIERYFVLDGHDRIQAALLEGVVPSSVAAIPISRLAREPSPAEQIAAAHYAEQVGLNDRFSLPPASIDNLNRNARFAYGRRTPRAVFAARAFEGGQEAWEAMMRSIVGGDIDFMNALAAYPGLSFSRERAIQVLATRRARTLSDAEKLELLDDYAYWDYETVEGVREAIESGDLPALENEVIADLLEYSAPPQPVPDWAEPLLVDALSFELRRATNAYVENRLNEFGIYRRVVGQPAERGQCLCCGYLSIGAGEDGAWEICRVCSWENGGDGPNHISLEEARRNFREFGASSRRRLEFVEPDGSSKYERGPPFEEG